MNRNQTIKSGPLTIHPDGRVSLKLTDAGIRTLLAAMAVRPAVAKAA